MIVLWIDPWTTTVGYALIEKIDNKMKLLDYWVILTTPKIEIKYKLLEIWKDLSEIISINKPDLITIEKLYFQNNIKTWIDVAQARWVILYESIKSGAKILEFTPLQVKKAVTSNWHANKLQLQTSIKILFWMKEIPKPDDAADAIWLAYMWALNSKIDSIVA